MAQISSDNGFKQDRPASPGVVRPKAPVGREEALRMEVEAMAKIQSEKRNTLPVSTTKAQHCVGASGTTTSRPERDLIFFPESETKKEVEKNTFADIDLEKLTSKELENLLLDNDFGKSKNNRSLSLISSNFRMSYPGGPALNPPRFPWCTAHSISNSTLSTTAHRQAPVFPSTSFAKPPCSFQNGFTPVIQPFINYPALQSPFRPFTPIQPAAPLVFQQSVVSPEMVKLFDKIASTSEYLKNGRSPSMCADTSSVRSLEPVPQLAEPPNMECLDWLDLDPLHDCHGDEEEVSSSIGGGEMVRSVPEEDPWDAVLKEETEVMESCSSSGYNSCSMTKRASFELTVSKSHSSATSTLHSQSKQVTKESRNDLAIDSVSQQNGAQNLEIVAFCEDIARLRSNFHFDDPSTNPGYALSPVIFQRDGCGNNNNSVKVSIEISDSRQPVTFTCDVSSPVELLIMQALCWVHDDLSQVDIGSYVLKVCGQEQVLQNKHSLGSHEHVQNCKKWETEIKLQLLTLGAMRRDLARTVDDYTSPIDLEKYLVDVSPFKETITRDILSPILENYNNQVNICLQNKNNQNKTVEQLIQAVQSLCNLLGEVETPAITDAVKRIKHSVNLGRTHSPEGGVQPPTSANSKDNPSIIYGTAVEEHIATLTQAMYDLVKLYQRSFGLFFSVDQGNAKGLTAESSEACSTNEHVQFTLFGIHGISTAWVSSYEKYYLMCSLTHNGQNLFKPIQSRKVGTYKSFFYHVKWDELINFPISVALLPLETILSLSLYGILNQNASNSPDSNKQQKSPDLLGKATMPLFDFKRVFAQGTKLLSFWTSQFSSYGGKGKNWTERLVLQIDFPSTSLDVLYGDLKEIRCPDLPSLEMPDPDTRSRIEKLCTGAFGLSRADRQLLWDWRHYCRVHDHSLPKVLASVPSWDWGRMAEIKLLLQQWPALSPVSALELLDSKFTNTEVRSMAVQWIDSCSDDELTDYLPQLVQALKFESHLNNSLIKFLLTRAQGNVNIAHYLYWLFRDAVQEPEFAQRYRYMLGALLCLSGAGMRDDLEKQSCLVQLLGSLAENVRQSCSSSRQMVLHEGLETVQSFFHMGDCRLPLSPSLVTKELNAKACSFFNSNALPLKLSLVNADPLGEEINVMFKVGEDLRQDMLALQMIRIMDRIWLQEGLDLRIVNFKCISTGQDKGMVELVPSSETLRKIQVEYGVTGSFKDKPLAEWLRKYNPAEDEYEKASENFIYSCAGCCVATYLLGICDRHNDNIMLRSTGHMFHIDFGKFLGHAQMIGSFKRDRTPFVLTSDMAYVINGGERPTSRFQLFVDLCSQAYNLIRKHSNLFLNLLALMTHSGLPELTGFQDLKYVYDALKPQCTDVEATIFFTRLIESSLGSVATKFNFFIHNLAQLRFSGLPSNDEPILSFSPRTYTMKQDSCIKEASIFSYQKKYNPDKHYTYVVRVLREGQSDPQFVFRTFDEFQELHNKLTILFPLWKLPGFPNKMVLGRTHIKDVASKRKVELNSYVHNLMRGDADVAQCDLIYTFFHPNAKDDKTEGVDGLPKILADEIPQSPTTGCVGGEVKLSVSYRNSTLFIMVMHIKDLVSEDGADPNPYVKTYLLPDPQKTSKRKTKVARKTRNPTFNEMLVYSGYSKETLKQRELQLSVLSAESLRENYYLGGITLGLKNFDLSQETVKWYKLTAVPYS